MRNAGCPAVRVIGVRRRCGPCASGGRCAPVIARLPGEVTVRFLPRDVIAVGDHLAILHGLREGGRAIVRKALWPRKENIHTPIRQHRVGRIVGEAVVGGAWCV